MYLKKNKKKTRKKNVLDSFIFLKSKIILFDFKLIPDDRFSRTLDFSLIEKMFDQIVSSKKKSKDWFYSIQPKSYTNQPSSAF